MTTRRTPKPTAPPLADTLRAALAQGWHTLSALDALAPARGSSDARRAVHEALRSIKAGGCTLEERVGKGGVEVRAVPSLDERERTDAKRAAMGPRTTPIAEQVGCSPLDALRDRATVEESSAPMPDDGQPGDLSPEDVEAIRTALLEADDDGDGAAFTPSFEIAPLSPAAAARLADMIEHPPAPSEALRALLAHAALDAQVAPVEAAGAPSARDRCATCGVPHGNHAPHDGHAFAPREPTDPHFVECRRCKADPGHPCKGDGAPHAVRAVDAEAWARVQDGLPPAPREPGPSSRCAVCGQRYSHHLNGKDAHPFQPKPRGRPPAPVRPPVAPIPNAAPAILPRGRQRRERGPVVDVDGGRVERAPHPAGMRESDASTVEVPPCIDCGEERGSCPEGRCRDCDIEHGMSAGACRECHTWIIREDVGGPIAEQHAAGCSLADSDDWHPRNAAEYAAVRTARYGWAPEPRRGCEREFPVVRVAPIVIAPPRPAGRCRPPLCHADDIHEPSRVRGFQRPLCERHRAWVEGAGGTLAAGGLAGVLP